MNLRRSGSVLPLPPQLISPEDRNALSQEAFHKMISVERKRSERSRKPFLLMLVDAGTDPASKRSTQVLTTIASTLLISTRETDITGWYEEKSVIGVMFTELGTEDRNALLTTMLARISTTLRDNLSFEQFSRVSISFHLFPEDWNIEALDRPSNPTLYPDLVQRDNGRKAFCVIKRLMDILGSTAALVLLSPLFLLIGIAIKLTSDGPMFYRQYRVGQHGRPFVFLKFRSMYANNDASTHKQYVKDLIAGKAKRQDSDTADEGVYKLTDDPRITPVGSFLRRSSFDELPQFFNVLKGEMSLVGPRPPIAYEVESYDLWHRRRLLEAKPGITGLWQVNGRNRIKFDEMVRLDLKYAKTWSPWGDFKIILRTPKAMLEGAH